MNNQIFFKSLDKVLDPANYNDESLMIPVLGAAVTAYRRYPDLMTSAVSNGINRQLLGELFKPPFDLQKVAQFAKNYGTERFKEFLNDLFLKLNNPDPIHCTVARWLKGGRSFKPAQMRMAVTTNYDCLLECALHSLDCSHLLLRYSEKEMSDGLGHFVLELFLVKGGKIISRAVEDLKDKKRFRELIAEFPLIFKLHGSASQEDKTFFITEAQYLLMLSTTLRERIHNDHLLGILQTARYLFMGYSLEDWHLRAFLMAVSSGQRLPGVPYRAWLVRMPNEPNGELNQALWEDAFIKDRFPSVMVEKDLNSFAEWIDQIMKPPPPSAFVQGAV